jgi:hypothetical protein
MGLGIRYNALSTGNLNYTASDGSAAKLKTGRDLGFGAGAEVALGWAI